MEPTPPELSVLIPTVLRREDLRRALRSVLDNGFEGTLEIVVSDDDPAGSAGPVVEEFGDARIRYVVNPGPPGKAANWSHAAAHARGTFCTKLDDDDLVRPGYLAKTVEVLRARPEVGSVYTAYEQVNLLTETRQEVVDRGFFRARPVVAGPEYARAVLTNEGGYPINHKTTAVYRRELAERFGHYQHVCEDFAFGVALAVEGDVAYVPEVLYEYRLHGGNSVADLPGLSRNSFAALQGLESLETVPAPGRVTAAEWRGWTESCRRALPLYFLLAALRTQGSDEAQHLYIDLKMEGRLTQPKLAWGLVNVLGLLPAGLLDGSFRYYQRSRWLRGLGRRLFRGRSG
ncbi:MAG: glycosyltransferase family 2 protein [Verrucomicrobiota bacterium]